ncbi:hypothetical protein TNCV_2737771 [Trichonephila clavipes]|nr:hypothetical protein TNCV_2737771 [Trichonephila clavipes]
MGNELPNDGVFKGNEDEAFFLRNKITELRKRIEELGGEKATSSTEDLNEEKVVLLGDNKQVEKKKASAAIKRFDGAFVYIVHSSHTIRLDCCNRAPWALFLVMLHVEVSSLARLRGTLKTEFAERPPPSSVSAIPEEATANVTLRSLRIFPRSKLSKKVLSVPPGASRKKGHLHQAQFVVMLWLS